MRVMRLVAFIISHHIRVCPLTPLVCITSRSLLKIVREVGIRIIILSLIIMYPKGTCVERGSGGSRPLIGKSLPGRELVVLYSGSINVVAAADTDSNLVLDE